MGTTVAFQSLKLFGVKVKFDQRASQIFTADSNTTSPVLNKLFTNLKNQCQRKNFQKIQKFTFSNILKILKSKPDLIKSIVDRFQQRNNEEMSVSLNIRPPVSI